MNTYSWPKPPLPRESFPVLGEYAYLDTARQGPLPVSTVNAMAAFLRDQSYRPGGDLDVLMEGAREKVAKLIGAEAAQIAFVKNTTEGVSFGVHGLPWRKGDRILVLADEHPAISYPWRMLASRGVRVETVPPSGAEGHLNLTYIAEQVSSGRVQVVALSWVDWVRGERRDLHQLVQVCRPHGVLVCVDAIQGLGTLPLDVRASGVDILTASTFKGLLGPDGVGLLYVRPGLELAPTEFGKLSTPSRAATESEPTPARSARRFEGGHLNAPGIVGLASSLDLILSNREKLWPHVSRLRAMVLTLIDSVGGQVLSPREEDRSSGIVSFDIPEWPAEEAVAELHRNQVWCSSRGGSVRLSLHGFTTEDDLERLGTVLKRMRRARHGRNVNAP